MYRPPQFQKAEERKLLSTNPFGEFRGECRSVLASALEKLFPKLTLPDYMLTYPPNPEFGELSSSICFELAKRVNKKPLDIAKKIVTSIDISKTRLIESVKVAGNGYLNFHSKDAELFHLTIESARALDESYGYAKTNNPLRIIVEHTSANPSGPIHIGTARNSILGDSLARILRARGHKVATHFYVDDVGKQIAIVSYGYNLLGQPKPMGKPDHWIGLIYAITSCITAIRNLKVEVKRLSEELPETREKLSKLQAELDSWIGVAAELHEKSPALFDKLLERINEDEDPEASVNKIMYNYERGESMVKELVRKVVNYCIEGFKQTFNEVGISWDSWDWESDLVWRGNVSKVIKDLKKTPYFTEYAGTLAIDVEHAAKDLNLKSSLGIPEEHEIPPLILVRSDGTTLYTTRDIAYSFWKFERADKVVNVIGMEQTLAQLQLRVVVSILGSPDLAQNLIHYTYEMVQLPGYRMSRRRGRYVTFDEIVEESTKRAYREVDKRSPKLDEKKKHEISKSVGVGAVKYAIISIAPTKSVVFTWDKVLNFEMNSAPFIQYAHARACSILKKAKEKPKKPNYGLLTHEDERNLILTIAKFPEVFVDAAENMKPSQIADFANNLADKFNSFYAKLPVIRAGEKDLRDARLALVDAVRITIRNSLRLLGIEALERM